jgi:hypothetical protein
VRELAATAAAGSARASVLPLQLLLEAPAA